VAGLLSGTRPVDTRPVDELDDAMRLFGECLDAIDARQP